MESKALQLAVTAQSKDDQVKRAAERFAAEMGDALLKKEAHVSRKDAITSTTAHVFNVICDGGIRHHRYAHTDARSAKKDVISTKPQKALSETSLSGVKPCGISRNIFFQGSR